jgi:hypothetical protein
MDLVLKRWAQEAFDEYPCRLSRIILVDERCIDRVAALCNTNLDHRHAVRATSTTPAFTLSYRFQRFSASAVHAGVFWLGCPGTLEAVHLLLNDLIGAGNYFVAKEDHYLKVNCVSSVSNGDPLK